MAVARVKNMNLPDAPEPTKAKRTFDPREKERQQRLQEAQGKGLNLKMRIDEGKPLCFWDKARLAKLRRLWEEGFQVPYIARETGCTPSSCKDRIRYEIKQGRLEKRRKDATSEQIQSIINRYKAGESIQLIAKEMKMSRYHVTNILEDRGVKE